MSHPLMTDMPLLRTLPPEALEAVAAQSRRHDVAARTTVLQEGAAADSLFFMTRGSALVVHGPESRVIGSLTAPTMFGEMALVAATPRLASVVTEEPSVLFELARDAVFAIAGSFPVVRDTILAIHRDRLMRNVLAASPLFEPLPEKRQRALAAAFQPHRVEAGRVLLQEGAPGAGLFVLLRGHCEVLRQAEGSPRRIGELIEGDVFGEISLILFEQTCTATVRTLGECVVLQLGRPEFQSIVMPDSEVRSRMVKLALARMRDNAILDGRDAMANKANLL